ncbi:5,10-methylenetetrahydrofolate reductase [Halodesulfurarchaeum formicicum]|uniref:5,10-methylenetetrahydrofolate reductase n=1 Tax=Halodesulfurarchaeum formicicum TaxID=1873524 RepID=A0A1D8S6D7_9EURY|nr:methylenetetrahydrofolate reductase [Halodesulfurarchaeum formicicum]AOW80915.1 5,10-methylenetetrahydrofolate reductase [Halodesulfurarchaeum formicicum]APE96248.1 methylenetetrahydrofolate reductase (NADPH) [Halodesulfurarchaeum formicicum]
MTQDPVRDLLADPHFELLPFAGLFDQAAKLPEGSTVALTASPDKGVDETVELSTELADRGFEVSAHIAARAVRSDEHLETIAETLLDAGVEDIFVPGGDNETPEGPYDSAYALLSDLEEMEYEFERVGITGYPEGHQFIDDDTLREHLLKKEEYADYIVTQMTFDPDAVADWALEIREDDVELPIIVGVPGVMKYQRLLSISREIGVGDSLSYLRKTTGVFDFIKQFLGSRGQYAPDDFIQGIGEYYADDSYGIEGVHLYTFNQVGDAEDWRQQYV